MDNSDLTAQLSDFQMPLQRSSKDNKPGKLDGLELLTFHSGGHGYAINIMSVREIRGWSEPTLLPHSKPWQRGVVNLRGSVLPVLDLAHRLGEGRTKDDPRNVIVIIEDAGKLHGLLVEAVSDIVRPQDEQLQDVPISGLGGNPTIAKHLFVTENIMLQVLSVEVLLEKTSLDDKVAL
ncbi:chemotaxis protein CheW [Jannaschia seosinensis]|uniref:chemotaxis protein CheW n=1 Tax=Jannaschia seosinensis TaxID=313367 RepID=UPI0009F86F98|nr:chemotaxis protein CheW [Jannaschia seosinensis]